VDRRVDRRVKNVHLGATTMTRWPLLARAMGRLPATSPRPPVLLHGATSEDTKMVSRGLSVCGEDFCGSSFRFFFT